MYTLRTARAVLNATVTALLLGSVLLASASTRVYKWVDKDGNVHFGEAPSAQHKNETIRLHDDAPRLPVPPKTADSDSNPDQEAVEATPEMQAATAQVQKYQKELKKYCSSARASIIKLSGLPRIMVQAKDGTGPARMTEEQRVTELARLRKGVASNCK